MFCWFTSHERMFVRLELLIVFFIFFLTMVSYEGKTMTNRIYILWIHRLTSREDSAGLLKNVHRIQKPICAWIKFQSYPCHVKLKFPTLSNVTNARHLHARSVYRVHWQIDDSCAWITSAFSNYATKGEQNITRVILHKQTGPVKHNV